MVPVLSAVIVHFSQHSHKSSRGSHALVTRSPTVAGSNADRAVARFTAWLAGAETVRFGRMGLRLGLRQPYEGIWVEKGLILVFTKLGVTGGNATLRRSRGALSQQRHRA